MLRIFKDRRSKALPICGVLVVLVLAAWFFCRLLARYGGIYMLPEYTLNSPAIVIFIISLIGFSILYDDVKLRLFHSQELAENAERISVEAELQALQAQVDPELLFRTLAHIEDLIERDEPTAKERLTHLNRYLRASLSQARGKSATLATEVDLLTAYAGMLNAVLRSSVSVAFEGTPQCGNVRFPPLLLQPLIQEFAQAGEGPLGILIAARIVDTRLEVSLRISFGHQGSAVVPELNVVQDTRRKVEALFGVRGNVVCPQPDCVVLTIPAEFHERDKRFPYSIVASGSAPAAERTTQPADPSRPT